MSQTNSTVPQRNRTEDSFQIFEENPLPMWIFDVNTLRFLVVNRAATEIYGYSREEFLAMTLRDIRLPSDIAEMERQVKSGKMSLGRTWTHVTKSGEKLLVRISSNPLEYQGHSARFVVAEDVTEREMLHAELVHSAYHDPLTGLPNRQLMEMQINAILHSGNEDRRVAALMCLELDRFKQIKEAHGRDVAEECLLRVTSLLRAAAGPHDCLCRSGGEEFTVLLCDCRSEEEAEIAASRLHRAISESFIIDDLRLQLTSSCGLALFPRDGNKASEIWRVADAAVDEARKAGGRRLVIASASIRRDAFERGVIERYTRKMLQENGLLLHYQPQYHTNGTLHGFEALLRLPHPSCGFIPPDRFISIAEENGMIDVLGDWVLKEACRQSSCWNLGRKTPVRIAVNVSPMQLIRPDFASSALALMQSAGVEPSWMEMEVTERVVVHFEESARQMHELSAAGVTFAIDDFGTGYSSLQHIDRLPVSVVKIDRSFVRGLLDERSSEAIVEAIVRMGHSLGMQVIAEGVETTEQLEILKSKDCDIIQGYLYSKPLTAADAGALLERL